MKNLLRRFSIGGFIFTILLCNSLPAQISITSTDILNFIGTTEFKEYDDTTGTITVNVGNAGANQSWDFTNVIMQQFLEEWRFLTPANTPFSNDFPSANMAIMIIEDATADTFYIFFRVDNTVFRSQGSVFFDQGVAYVEYDSSDALPLPLTFGSQWTQQDTTEIISPGFRLEQIEFINAEIDAWGTITIPSRTVNCLRHKENVTDITNLYINGVLTSSDTTRYINYEWLGNEILLIANAESQEDETNPNFTQAAYFLRSVTTVGLQNNQTVGVSDYILYANYPNPFNPVTTIEFYLPNTGEVTLKIFNVLGEEVTTLLSASLLSGFHSYQWDAGNMPSGIYYYTIQAG